MKANQEAIKQYVRDCIDLSDHPDHDTVESAFRAEYGHNVENGVIPQADVASWLQGLPTACTVAFSNHEILDLCVEWGLISPDATERQEDKMLDQYWSYMSAKLLQVMREQR